MRLYRRRQPDGSAAPYWTATWTERGVTVRRSTGKTDRHAAELVFREWQRKQADPTYIAADATRLRSALSRSIADLAMRGRAEGTLRMHDVKGRHLLRILGDVPLGGIDARAVDEYIRIRRSEGAAQGTIHKELSCLRVALRVARRRREYPYDPRDIMPVGFSAGYRPRTRYLTEEEAAALLGELSAERGAFVAFVLATGARHMEAQRVRREDVDLTERTVHLRGTKTAGADRVVPILETFVPYVRRALAEGTGIGGLLFRMWLNVRRDLRIACARVGIDPVSPNDIRRTHATWLRRWGVAPDLIARMLGHRDNRMVELVYGRLPVADLKRLIQLALDEPIVNQK